MRQASGPGPTNRATTGSATAIRAGESGWTSEPRTTSDQGSSWNRRATRMNFSPSCAGRSVRATASACSIPASKANATRPHLWAIAILRDQRPKGDWGFQIPDSRFQIPDSRFQNFRFQIPKPDSRIPDSKAGFQNSRFQSRIPEFQIPKPDSRIPDSKAGFQNSRFQSRIPEFQIPKPDSRIPDSRAGFQIAGTA